VTPLHRSTPVVMLAALSLALGACGGSEPEPGRSGGGDLDVPLAAPCDAVDAREVEAVLGGPPRIEAELAPTDVYPEGLTGYAAGAPAGRFVCIYQGEGTAEVSVAVAEPNREEFDIGRTSASQSGCAFDPAPTLGGESYTLRCTPGGEPPFVAYVLLTPSSLVQCLGGATGAGLATLEPQVERACRGVVDRLSA
jgi:hypothetical protein